MDIRARKDPTRQEAVDQVREKIEEICERRGISLAIKRKVCEEGYVFLF